MKIGLYAHGGSGNHGCEAIVRSTLKLLGGNEYTIFSERPDDDIYYGLDKFARVVAVDLTLIHFFIGISTSLIAYFTGKSL